MKSLEPGGLSELGLVLVAALSPMYFQANSIGADEFVKSGTGVAAAGAVVAIYRLFVHKEKGTKQDAA